MRLIITGEADQIIVKWIVQSVKLSGGWFGLGADEGRAKLRNVPGRRKEPSIREYPNGTSCH